MIFFKMKYFKIVYCLLHFINYGKIHRALSLNLFLSFFFFSKWCTKCTIGCLIFESRKMTKGLNLRQRMFFVAQCTFVCLHCIQWRALCIKFCVHFVFVQQTIYLPRYWSWYFHLVNHLKAYFLLYFYYKICILDLSILKHL